MYEDMLRATPAYAVLTTPGNDRLDQIAAGRRWLRLHPAATTLGMSLHPVFPVPARVSRNGRTLWRSA